MLSYDYHWCTVLVIEFVFVIVCELSRLDYAESPIFRSHLQFIHDSKELRSSVQAQAARANMSWIHTEIRVIMQQLHDPDILQRLLIDDRRKLAESTPAARVRMKEFLSCSACTASERAWFMLGYSYLAQEQPCGQINN